jgi:hypothetical protein
MATLTTIYQPFSEKHSDYTKPKADYLITTGSAATAGGVEIFADATASDDFFLTSLNVSFLAPTANAVFTSYIGKNKIATYPTLAASTPKVYSHSFGAPGISGVTTTTATVCIVGDAANTATVQFCATGWRKI